MYVCIYIDVEHHGMATMPPFTHTVHTYIGQLLCCQLVNSEPDILCLLCMYTIKLYILAVITHEFPMNYSTSLHYCVLDFMTTSVEQANIKIWILTGDKQGKNYFECACYS